MKKACIYLVLLAVGFLAVAGVGRSAEPVRVVKPGDKLEANIVVRKILGLNRQYIEKTPVYSTTAERGKRPSGEWAQIMLTYDTDVEWLDDLTVQFFVMTQKLEDGKKTFSMFKTTVSYADIEKGRDHIACVFLKPAAIKRFGYLIGIAAEVSSGGKTIAEKHAEEAKLLPENWWKNDAITTAKDVVHRDGYLVPRSKTPFALVNVDDYEAEK